ncbi:hypothetical protein F0562_020459 [Nyssa sinensis]|uniref:J domain-containing protein n=1 Tax=Nyssa sinensis TaxID=561372 RepID=A0A5J5BVK5_9ASTE|nr:hypothetical protein F0562_020459 [Nyssa sinensis]
MLVSSNSVLGTSVHLVGQQPRTCVRFRQPKIVASYTSLCSDMASSFYEVLGIPASASGYEIKAAYRRLARTCHPDVVATNVGKERSATEFMKIHAAYSTLSDPDKRATYDRDLFRLGRPFGSPSVTSAAMTAASSTSSKLGYSQYGQ